MKKEGGLQSFIILSSVFNVCNFLLNIITEKH